MKTQAGSELRKFVAPEFIFGNGARWQVGKYALNMGCSKVLLVTDGQVSKAGWVADVINNLEENGIEAVVFSDITPNPKDYEVANGIELYNQCGCDSVIAVGGGSPMDCAKAIAILANNPGHILDYVGVDTIYEPCPPLICLPTTSGSAADVSQFAIITDTANKVKKAIISKAIVPDVSLIDPETTTTMPEYLTACTGMDALTHAVEAYVSNASSQITDLHALKAIELVGSNLRNTIDNPADTNLRELMSLASLEAGLAFSNASLGAVHAMAHSLGGYLDLPHGECNAMLLEHVINYNIEASSNKYASVARALGVDVAGKDGAELAGAVFDVVRRLRESVGIKNTLGGCGVDHSDVEVLARHASADPCLVTNPRRAGADDLKTIYKEAM